MNFPLMKDWLFSKKKGSFRPQDGSLDNRSYVELLIRSRPSLYWSVKKYENNSLEKYLSVLCYIFSFLSIWDISEYETTCDKKKKNFKD